MELPPKDVRFKHTPMNFKNKEIRLLTIEPRSEPAGPIHITIKHVDFSGHIDALARCQEEVARVTAKKDECSYEQRKAFFDEFLQGTFDFTALSYTWGPESPVEDILVTSPECRGWLSIRQNLYDFLRTRRDCSPAWFWIDQICINQGKDDEKAHQVNQMADIYSTATAVEVWLGLGFEGSDELIDVIVCESLHMNQSPQLRSTVSRREMHTFIPPLRTFINLPYWSRLWVIQEIVLGKVVDIRIGSKTVSWDKFILGWQWLNHTLENSNMTDLRNPLERLLWEGINGRILAIEDSRRTPERDWHSVWYLVEGTQSSDLRDRAFGAMGMVRPSLRIFPDYSMQLQDVLLALLTKQAGVMRSEFEGFSGNSYIRLTCILTAEGWILQLMDKNNSINQKSVRRHLLKILPLDPPQFHCPIGRRWQLKCYLWYHMDNERSKRWQLAHAGFRPFELVSELYYRWA